MKKHPLYRKIGKIAFVAIAGIVALFIVISIAFYIYRDQIGRKLVLQVNHLQNGQISFSTISFSPFIHFPHMSVNLKEVYYLGEEHADSLGPARDTIATLGNLYIAVDITRLIIGDVDIPKITLADGRINLVKHHDSTLNVMQALGIQANEIESERMADTLDRTSYPDLLLDAVSLRNIQIRYVDSETADTAIFDIQTLNASLDYRDGYISTILDLDSEIKGLKLLNATGVKDLKLMVNTALIIDEHLKKITFKPSVVNIEHSSFNISGTLAYASDGFIDLKIEAKDEDLSFFRLLLTETGLKNLTSGEIYLSGTIKGPFSGQLPEIQLDFGMQNVNLAVPGVNQGISDLTLQGSFLSGRKTDLSEAVVLLNKCTGNLPGGYVNAALSVENFAIPQFNLELNLETDITGFDEVFSIQGLQDLGGAIKLHTKYAGLYDPLADTVIDKTIDSEIELDSVSFKIPEFIGIKYLCGEATQGEDSLMIKNLSFNAANSDFLINGRIDHLFSLLYDTESQVIAALRVQSDTFDLPDFFNSDPRVGRSFPHRIIGVDAEVMAVTSGDKLADFESNPEINFEIRSLSATIESLFPEVIITKGTMFLMEKDGRIFLDFNDFDLEIAEGNIHADVIYHSPAHDPDLVKVDAVISALNVADMFFKSGDSIPGIARGVLTGNIKTEIDIGLDSLDFESLNLAIETLNYTTEKDTFDIAELGLLARKVYYQGGSNPLSTLTADIDMKAQQVTSNHFSVQDVNYAIKANEGNFTVHPEKIQFFGKEGEGIYRFSPFATPPRYEMKYNVSEFRIDNLLANLMADTLLTGLMDFDLDVALTDSSQRNLLSGINGYVKLHGKDLTIYGIDLDNFIAKYQRSQKFNLADLGAVALAGPFGLALTKGSEYAALAIGDFGEETKVSELYSEWDLISGRLILEDVAFTTANNLVACQGWVDFSTDSLNVTVAVLDKNRCSIVSQAVYGHLEDPQYGDVNIVSTVLGPVTNLIDGAMGRDCEQFYNGKLLHPKKKK